MTRGEILDGPECRRRWSEHEKTEILAELAKPGSKGAEIARRYGVSRGLLYTWRKERQFADAATRATEVPFAPVLLTSPGPQNQPPSAPSLPPTFIEIEMKGARVRLPGDTPASIVAAAIKSLRGR